MSADSPRRAAGHIRQSATTAANASQVVLPQPVSDKSIIDSVAGIINDIVPQVNRLHHFVIAFIVELIYLFVCLFFVLFLCLFFFIYYSGIH